MAELDQHLLRAQYDAMTSLAGLHIPADRDEEMFRAFVALRDLLSLVHKPWAYADEPAYVAARLPQTGEPA
jgi:hypothetical protein